MSHLGEFDLIRRISARFNNNNSAAVDDGSVQAMQCHTAGSVDGSSVPHAAGSVYGADGSVSDAAVPVLDAAGSVPAAAGSVSDGDSNGIVGIGDDCAVLPRGDGLDTLVTTDLLIEDRHFLLRDITPYQLGWKSAAVNISDIAAMGGTPEASFLSIALPKTLPVGSAAAGRESGGFAPGTAGTAAAGRESGGFAPGTVGSAVSGRESGGFAPGTVGTAAAGRESGGFAPGTAGTAAVGRESGEFAPGTVGSAAAGRESGNFAPGTIVTAAAGRESGESAPESAGVNEDVDSVGRWVDRFMDGYKALSDRFGVPLLGGDTSASPDKLFINVTVLGTCPHGAARLRSAARPGDLVCVTGSLGDAAAGLKLILERTQAASDGSQERSSTGDSAEERLIRRHYMPIPRVKEGISLRQCLGVHAMMDVSDGIASDLRHILEASGAVWKSVQGAQEMGAPHETGVPQGMGRPQEAGLPLEAGVLQETGVTLWVPGDVPIGAKMAENALMGTVECTHSGTMSANTLVPIGNMTPLAAPMPARTRVRPSIGAEIDLRRLPLSPELLEICAARGWDPAELAVSGGEDYELLFTVAPEAFEAAATAVRAASGGTVGITAIGRITESTDITSAEGPNAPSSEVHSPDAPLAAESPDTPLAAESPDAPHAADSPDTLLAAEDPVIRWIGGERDDYKGFTHF